MNQSRMPSPAILVAVMALVAALASTAVAGPDASTSAISEKKVKKLIKKEVAKQIENATGPPGPPGTNGTNGTNGADGTARAYARVIPGCTGGGGNDCTLERDKGITRVTRVATGRYCVTAPGLDPASVPAAVTVDELSTADPQGNATAMTDAFGSDCPGGSGQFEVVTDRQPVTAVRNAADTGSINVSGNAAPADDVGFTIVIP